MAVGDVNNDLKPDLAIVNAIPSGPVCAKPAEVFLGNGDGTFSSPIGTAYFHGSTIDILDVNGDGQLELVGSNPISVWLGNGDGVFDVMGYYTGSGPSVAGGDFNLDGRTDLAVAYGSALILLNLSGPTALTFEADRMTLVWPAVTGALSYDIYRGDASVLVDGDDDGLPDSGYGACMTALDDDPHDTFFVDAETPSEGEGFFYLISVIDAHGDGGIGTTSDGLPRLPQVPCP